MPQGAVILYSPLVVQRRADLFPKPDLFEPDRFASNFAQQFARGAYTPFGIGARKCIGDVFGTIEAILALASIVARWEFRPLPGLCARAALRGLLAPKSLPMRTVKRTIGTAQMREPS
ncbi:cytochrome P450 [Lentzea roselyniae]|uniref:cytochrome P450 n=1 Tax=Lentzea roselyniae TaxID=531940 RepID=UPI003D1589B3